MSRTIINALILLVLGIVMIWHWWGRSQVSLVLAGIMIGWAMMMLTDAWILP